MLHGAYLRYDIHTFVFTVRGGGGGGGGGGGMYIAIYNVLVCVHVKVSKGISTVLTLPAVIKL